METLPHIEIIIGSTREQRRGEPIARWFGDVAARREDLSSDLVDLAQLRLPVLAHSTPPMSGESRDPGARPWSVRIAAADGYVVVTPEYNHGYPAPLKNALDHLFSEWRRKPIGFISYGAASGGVRAVEQLRQVAIELDMVPIRRQIAIPRVWAAIDSDGVLREPPVAEANALLDDIAWWATTLRAGREAASVA
jgi:NAD(P)H-dependent FMN reductase